MQPKCIVCSTELPGSHIHRKYCSQKCKRIWQNENSSKEPVTEHVCRICSTAFPITKGQYNKWLCSPECRKSSNALSVRTFHNRRPQMVAIYRARTKEKKLPDSNILRFYRSNPSAPRACESCGEDRVLEIAHKPGSERVGEWRSAVNCKWPEMVWVLCPTCHRLHDRMNYSPEELGLKL